MSDRPFAETLAGVQDGEESAASDKLARPPSRLLRFLRTRHASHDVDDLASEVWLRASRSWQRFSGDEGDFRAWFFSIARAVSIDSYRLHGRRREQLAADLELRMTRARARRSWTRSSRSAPTGPYALLARLPRAG